MTNLTASKMSTISPVYICTTVIICMNECMDDHLVYLILNVHVVATYNYLNKAKPPRNIPQNENQSSKNIINKDTLDNERDKQTFLKVEVLSNGCHIF